MPTDTFRHRYMHTHTTCAHTRRRNHTQTSPRSYFPEQFPCLYSSPQHRAAALLVFCPTQPLILSDAPPLTLLPRLFPFSLHSSSPADLVMECKNSRQWNVRWVQEKLVMAGRLLSHCGLLGAQKRNYIHLQSQPQAFQAFRWKIVVTSHPKFSVVTPITYCLKLYHQLLVPFIL